MIDEKLVNLTENDIKVMSFIGDKVNGVGFSKAKGTTIDAIKEKAVNLSISESKVRNALTKLISKGYVDLGIKKGKKNTYHITTDGLNFVSEIKQTVINLNKKEE